MTTLGIGFAVFLAVLVPLYWRTYGPTNFLWVSDVGLFLTAAAVWLDARLLLGMAVLTALPFELAWTVEYVSRLLFGKRLLGATDYMFDTKISVFVRALSLFHFVMPVLWLALLELFGYDKRTLQYEVVLFVLLALLTLVCTDRRDNINFVFPPKNWRLPTALWVSLYVTLIPLVALWPLHAVLARWFTK